MTFDIESMDGIRIERETKELHQGGCFVKACLEMTNGAMGIIVQCKSGVLYQNQCGGLSCIQMTLEGAFIPINVTFRDDLNVDVLSPIEVADALDDLLKAQEDMKITVDRSRIDESFEAWVRVKIVPLNGIYGVSGATVMDGVLVWENSD